MTRGSIILLVSLIVIDTLIVGTWFRLEEVKQRVETTTVATVVRVELNRDNIPLINDDLILGASAGTLCNVFTTYRLDGIAKAYDYVHNNNFYFLVERADRGCLPLLVLIFAPFIKEIQVMSKRKTLKTQIISLCRSRNFLEYALLARNLLNLIRLTRLSSITPITCSVIITDIFVSHYMKLSVSKLYWCSRFAYRQNRNR